MLAVDMPGFGRATPLDPSRPVLTQHDEFTAALVRDVAEKYGRKVVLVGNSLGGAATLRAGTDHSLPLAGLVPVSPAGFDHSWAIKFAEHQRDISPLLARRGLPMPVVRSIVGVAFRTASCGRPRRADREAVRLYVEQFQTRADLLRVLGSANGVIEELGVDRLWDIEVPVLLLWGDRDRLTLFRGSQRVVQLIPQTELVVLHGSGHCPQLEIAPRVAKLIADFTDRVGVPL
jgi:pimeloyl-ACP methyl ester carboxylesterase